MSVIRRTDLCSWLSLACDRLRAQDYVYNCLAVHVAHSRFPGHGRLVFNLLSGRVVVQVIQNSDTRRHDTFSHLE